MRVTHRIGAWAIGLFLFSSTALAAPPPADPAAEEMLKSKGLMRVSQQYLVDEDVRLRDVLKTMRQSRSQLDAAIKRREMLEANLKDMDRELAAWHARFREVNDALNRTRDTVDRNNLIGQINSLSSRIEQGQKVRDDKEKEFKRFAVPRDDYVTATIAASNQMEAAMAKYEELAKDPEVTAALAKINATVKPPVKLGPSPQLAQEIQITRKARQTVDSAVIKVDVEHGVPRAPVELNGSVTEVMIIDSGASSLMLSWDVAQRCGLKPGKDDQRVEMTTADGAKRTGWWMKLDSVRLGQFTVNDVECSVMPPEVKGIDCLLGGTFMKNFVARMDLAAGELHLTQITGKTAKAASLTPTRPPTAPAGRNGNELIDRMKGATSEREDGAIVLTQGDRIRTPQSFKPPVTFKFVAKTDSSDLRFAYGCDQIIFNWEVNKSELRVDGGVIGGQHRPGKGEIPVNKWVNFEVVVKPDQMIITADGKERLKARGDFSKIDEPLSIFTAGNQNTAKVSVKSVIVIAQ
jgi:clan AA aspartic protease (TIGR02281 family)